MKGAITKRNIFEVRETVSSNQDIIPYIVAAHIFSGCALYTAFSTFSLHCCPI